jgi:hypothetical protein
MHRNKTLVRGTIPYSFRAGIPNRQNDTEFRRAQGWYREIEWPRLQPEGWFVQGLTEFSQLPTLFSLFALIFIVKPRVFIVAF